MSADYINFDIDNKEKEIIVQQQQHKVKDIDTNLEIIDEYHMDKATSYLSIISKVLYLASPIIFMYFCHMIWSTLIYANVSDRPLYIIEGKSIVFIYYYTIVIGVIWGFSIGFEIKGSRAYGAGDYNAIYNLISYTFAFYVIFIVILIILSNTIVPIIIQRLPFKEIAVDNFRSEMLVLSLTFPLIAVICLLGRLSNMLQRNHILNYASLYSLIVQIFGSWLFMNYLQCDSYGMGLTFLFTYITKAIVIIRDFIIEKPQGFEILNFNWNFIKVLKESRKEVVDMFNFSLFPTLNVMVILLSSEINSYIGLIISNLTFTTLCIYFNIYSIIALIFEAIGNSMTILVSYAIGKEDYEFAWKVWKGSVRIVVPTIIVIVILIRIFSKEILSLYSIDPDFQILAYSQINKLCISLVLASFHYVLSEFIITCGYLKFPFYISLLLRFGFHMIYTTYLIVNYQAGLSTILTNWIIAQFISLIIFLIKIFHIYYIGIEKNFNSNIKKN